MIEKNHEIIIRRGESFTIDKLIVNRDDSPYLVSSEHIASYLLITVASTSYEQENAYKINWWLSLDTLPKFVNTQPKKISAFDVANVTGDNPYDFVYYTDDVTNCKYFDSNDKWYDYNFRIVHHFPHEITKTWVGQNYLYSLRLVSGVKTEDYIKNLYKSVFNVANVPIKTVEELYNDIKDVDENYVKDVNISRPLVSIDFVQDILSPSKLTVLPDLNGGIR